MSSSSFFFYPKNRRLTPLEKSCLDDHSRQMARIMISTQEEFHFHERLGKGSSESISPSIIPPFMVNRGVSRSVSSGSGSSGTGTSSSSSTSPHRPVSSDGSSTSSVSTPLSTCRAQLVVNPFYDPSYRSKTTTDSIPATSSIKLIANPFYDPSYGRSNSSKATSTPAESSGSGIPVKLIANPFYDPDYVSKSTSCSDLSSSSDVRLVPNPFYMPSYARQ